MLKNKEVSKELDQSREECIVSITKTYQP